MALSTLHDQEWQGPTPSTAQIHMGEDRQYITHSLKLNFWLKTLQSNEMVSVITEANKVEGCSYMKSSKKVLRKIKHHKSSNSQLCRQLRENQDGNREASRLNRANRLPYSGSREEANMAKHIKKSKNRPDHAVTYTIGCGVSIL